MESTLVILGLYACFALILVGALLAFPAEPPVVIHHWSGVLPGDTVVVHGEERQVVEVDLDRDQVKVDRPFDWGPIEGDWVSVRHGAQTAPPLGAH